MARNIADGSSLYYLFNFLKDILKNFKIENFRISKEYNDLFKRVIEPYKDVETFETKYLELLKLSSISCEIGPYFRISSISINRKDCIYTFYVDNNEIKYKSKISEDNKDFYTLLEKYKEFNRKQEFLISLRKARYVDPCYVNDEYIEEKYQKFI